VTCTFVNNVKRGALLIHKTRKHAADGPGDHPQANVDFTVTNANNGTNSTKTTGPNGYACLANVPVSALDGAYNVSESVPAGYAGEADKSYTVVEGTTCLSATAQEWHNTPLTDISVDVDSQIDGGTASSIDCGNGHTATTGANGDGSLTLSDQKPGTITCTIVVDP
jgi:hypothetical protein